MIVRVSLLASVPFLIGLVGCSMPGSAPTTPSRAYSQARNLPASGVALEGYCPVAYFAVNKPVRGQAKYAADHDGVTYYLVSADARKSFVEDPQKYVPAYGGWCAFGMSVEDKFPVDPTNFKIVNGKLHVFLRNNGIDALELWNKGNEPTLKQKADRHWKRVRS